MAMPLRAHSSPKRRSSFLASLADALYLSPNEIGLGQRESIADVARVLRKTQTHVKVLLFRAREVLRRELKAAQEPDAPTGPVTPRTKPGRGDVFRRTCADADGVGVGRVSRFFGPVLIPEPATVKKGLL